MERRLGIMQSVEKKFIPSPAKAIDILRICNIEVEIALWDSRI